MNITTISHLRKYKQRQQKFAAITAYDAAFASLFEQNGIQVMLVGDSLGMTIQGNDSTLPVTLEDMIYHTRCVRRGAPYCLLIADLPFMCYATLYQAYDNAAALMRAGANIVKLEGGGCWVTKIVRCLTDRAVPVCCHLGLTPQSVNILGGYKIQGRDKDSADRILSESIALELAGAQMLVLECVPITLSERIADVLTIPVIGIGAGPVTDGQILVMQDILGITGNRIPSFAKNFLTDSRDIPTAIQLYVQEVETGKFPAVQHYFS
ncbi:3-methyl-2-oxobutanoate hydroxymethyltransferase [Candidatus Palibaumannia cicadellinicola]|uniref:3-methyl-2-oxobutanoate hydroxymethyltransferase n=1 Tax=Baumannia cicadellinicola subsp. Homalodisca coagulata TaxID=374463 RepID=PANB_BAUCH|nr:3-methyl-2-oxobutanoate hydroxymethyltransferase [Candidatus Baumannia cicadellinicola]Q1LTN1.1 RecName: Full=3-methyl-2-oxobutanoate hydroxymethyltransferase; AltName: Full=Ketopantoate hydroxymethyltransferase; Short=KPHMT [Baumannia cicadellinicola str. Hc (Homalodisca coagulata)]ABF14057.1 3-methyl-2-oxobutanoate hydroxymethyltransferase [Baumannia cicadellinicola str. Hc (Homalodisca coagulata)]MBS0032695.1 3-methyl-2-oxobutanoate hydroxymethyltransferase [Candidatus Baumannia cicadellin